MKKRAGLARAMALNPKILFFDEPSAGLDPITSSELDDLILHLNRILGTTMVIVTHELESIFAVAQRIIMLDKNSKGIIAEGDPRYLRDHSQNPFVKRFFNRRAVKESSDNKGTR
jgi:phospholipid/cholesterol/gamma-HCH transport system ATP-binding protein